MPRISTEQAEKRRRLVEGMFADDPERSVNEVQAEVAAIEGGGGKMNVNRVYAIRAEAREAAKRAKKGSK